MGLEFPSKVINSPEFQPILRHVFSYHADIYDLEAYEAIRPGFGRTIWGLICAERDLQASLKRYNQPNFLQRIFG
jgi:hypothetical protein